MNRMRNLLAGCGSCLVLAGAIGACVCISTPGARAKDSAGTASPAPNDQKPKTESTSRKDDALGRRVPNFVLADAQGKEIGLADFREKNYVALVFINTQCPVSNQYLPILNEIQQKYDGKGLTVVAINSQTGDTPEKIAEHAKAFKIAFPVLCDARHIAADILGAERTCEVFLLDPQRVVRYHGRIDDRLGYTTKRDEPSRHDLSSAIDDLLADRAVSVNSTDVAGCLISRPKSAAVKDEITYSKQVARIIQEKCQDCHHPNTAAPFALMNYEDAVNWAAMMKEVVLQRRMPPWHADPRFGDFREERRLSQDEIETVVAWINNGTPEGNPKDLPKPVDYPDGWRIGKPDVVLELPREITLPATGTIPYMYFETPTNFTEDMYIQAAEARPGNRAAVHHILIFYKAPGDKQGKLFENWIDGAAPGNIPLQLPEGVGRKIPAGSTIVWQMHYTATGKEEKDRSQYAFRFCKEKPKQEARVASIRNHRFRIPAGDPNYRVDSSFTTPNDVLLYSFSPHMHVRGKDFDYTAVYPDGTKEILLSVPQYDFNWQSAYRLKTPKRLPAGTRIDCTAHYDNSKGNPANPDPTKQVTWGDQTWQEMMIGYVDYVVDASK